MIPLIQENLGAIEALCKRHGVKRLFLIGSAATGAFDPAKSDLDFMVVFEPGESRGWDDPYFQLLADLQALFQRDIDLLVAKALRNPYLIASINETKRLLYAA